MGCWRDAEDERTVGVHDRLFEAADAAIGAEHGAEDGGTSVEAVMTPYAVELGPLRLEFPVALLLTSSHLVLACGHGFRHRTPEVTTIERADVTDPGEPTARTDCFVVSFRHATYGDCSAYFGLIHEAEFFASNLWRDELAAPVATPPRPATALPPPPVREMSTQAR